MHHYLTNYFGHPARQCCPRAIQCSPFGLGQFDAQLLQCCWGTLRPSQDSARITLPAVRLPSSNSQRFPRLISTDRLPRCKVREVPEVSDPNRGRALPGQIRICRLQRIGKQPIIPSRNTFLSKLCDNQAQNIHFSQKNTTRRPALISAQLGR